MVKKSGDTLIKQFLRQQENHLELRQFNPESTTELPLTDIASIYRNHRRGVGWVHILAIGRL